MTTLRNSIQRFFKPVQPLPPGVYHYQSPGDDPRNYRLHLRLEPDGGGILIVNAATILHLNQTAAEYAYYLVQNLSADQVATKMGARYKVSRSQAETDYLDLAERIQTLIETPDLDPVSFLGFERQVPFSGHITAPYRIDCALTYRLPESAPEEAAPHERVDRELSTDEWSTILDKAWVAGIPHIVFTGGEPTLRDDLPELIEKAEANNQVTGLLTDGLRLVDDAYLQTLLNTGLDHLMIRFHPDNALSWQALERLLPEDIFVAVHLTIDGYNREQIPGLIARLDETGVHEISLSADSPDLIDDLEAARNLVADSDLDLVWNLPVPYSVHNPITLETGRADLPDGAGRAWLYVEPDGDVLPSQGLNQVRGNFLTDPWETIWKHN